MDFQGLLWYLGGEKLPFSSYIPIIVLFIIIFIMLRNRRAVVARKVIKKRNMEDRIKMKELAKRIIGKECIIYAFDSNHQFDGVITEVSEGALLIEKDEKAEAINLDFVIRIREYPRNKKGKKKSVVLD